MASPSLEQVREYFRDTVYQQVVQNEDLKTKLWVYVAGHSFEMDEGISILLNDTFSLNKR
jgi:hypothetical protein